MKKRTILSAICSLGVAVAALASPADITIHANQRPATSVFAEIMRQSGKNFVYASEVLNGVKVTVNANGRPLNQVLDEMFAGTGISWKMRGNNIILTRSKAPQASPARATATVSGFVREEGTGEPLAGVRIESEGGGSFTATNAMGFYSITIPAGATRLTATYMGFNPAEASVKASGKSLKTIDITMKPAENMLREVTVTASPNRTLAMDAAEIGSLNVGKTAILATPVIFGESDIIKTLQLEPGVSAGVEGMAGMYVHGGNTDENLYMLDNVPLYQVNHFGGLFSAFNTEALRNVDFYKSSFPAKYDGRLSSYMDVNTKDGSLTEHHGSVKLGLTSGAFNIDGPIWKNHTSYSFAIRRSWYDLLTIPTMAIVNSRMKDEHNSLGYAFTDINAKINHRFSARSSAHVMFYYGEDYLRVNQWWDKNRPTGFYDEYRNSLRWGNIVASAGWNYVFGPKLFGEVTAAYSRYASRLGHFEESGDKTDNIVTSFSRNELVTHNNINDWIVKADFDWRPAPDHKINFGAGYTLHRFLPARSQRTLSTETSVTHLEENPLTYRANEANFYFGGDWQAAEALRVNYGLHYSLFNIEGKTHQGLSPRLALRWIPAPDWAVKAGYSRTVQYVHQLIQSSISLPTDQWVPITADDKPQTADKISAGVYYTLDNTFTFSIEGYWKWMKNLLDYADEYYLMPPTVTWDNTLTPGNGTSKGIDFKVSKDFGKFTGHIAYSLLWADRCFEGKNQGRKFPARFDNRHKINIMVNWKISDKWEASAAWTGMSGNRISLPVQLWEDPGLAPYHYDMLMAADVNNFRLPFYHRLDLSFKRNTRRGYWTFSLYNAYCNLNTIAVHREYADRPDALPTDPLVPVFQKIRLIPIIPSVSYTWLF